jgi:hypothetical protein
MSRSLFDNEERFVMVFLENYKLRAKSRQFLSCDLCYENIERISGFCGEG